MAKKVTVDPLDADVHLAELLRALDFSEEEVVDASKQQPVLFMEAARYRAQTMRRRMEAEAALSVLRAGRASRFRADKREIGDKVTEGQVSEKLNLDRKVIAGAARLATAQVEEEYAKLLMEGYRMRRDALKITADVIGAEVYISKMNSGETTELAKIKSKLMSKYPGNRRT